MIQSVFSPRPGAAPMASMILAQTWLEIRLTLRNGEQLVLTVVIPALLLVLFGSIRVPALGSGGIDYLVPGVMTIAVLSTAFTGQAISTGFDRRSGVLKRLSASPLSRSGLIVAKTLAVASIEVIQLLLIALIGRFMGWSPSGGIAPAIVLLAMGTASFSGLGLLMAGTLRAEATLAVANLLFLLLLAGGGIFVPLTKFPAGVRPVLSLLPTAALSDGLRQSFGQLHQFPFAAAVILLGWALVSIICAAVTFRWE